MTQANPAISIIALNINGLITQIKGQGYSVQINTDLNISCYKIHTIKSNKLKEKRMKKYIQCNWWPKGATFAILLIDRIIQWKISKYVEDLTV